MGWHCLTSDGLGVGMAIFVYSLMSLGNFLFYYSHLEPVRTTDEEAFTDRLIEYICYLVLWTLMVFSHLRTMCVDPGFIPLEYEYDEEVLARPFKTLAQVEIAIRSRGRESENDLEAQNRS